MIREDLPFRVLMHNCRQDNLEYQPSIDWVGCSGVADFKKLIGVYEQHLIDSGVDAGAARKKSHGVLGASVFMKEQYLVIGIQGWEPTEDANVNKERWKQVMSLCRHHLGQRMSGSKSVDETRRKTVVNDHVNDRVYNRAERKPDLVDAVADMVQSDRKRAR